MDEPEGHVKLLRPEEVGQMLGLKASTVRRWARDGLLPGVVRLGHGKRKALRFVAHEIERFIERRRNG